MSLHHRRIATLLFISIQIRVHAFHAGLLINNVSVCPPPPAFFLDRKKNASSRFYVNFEMCLFAYNIHYLWFWLSIRFPVFSCINYLFSPKMYIPDLLYYYNGQHTADQRSRYVSMWVMCVSDWVKLIVRGYFKEFIDDNACFSEGFKSKYFLENPMMVPRLGILFNLNIWSNFHRILSVV